MNWCASNCVNSETAPCSECKNSYQHKVDCSKYNLCYQCRQLEPKPEGRGIKMLQEKARSRGWSDQPAILERYEIAFAGGIGKESVEVRPTGDGFYITVGNLFGSQTAFAGSATAMLKALHAIACGRSIELKE